MIVSGGGFLIPWSCVPGACPRLGMVLDEIDSCIKCGHMCIVSGVRWVKIFRNVLRRHFIEEFENVQAYTLRNSFLGGFRQVDNVDSFNYGSRG